MKLRLQFLVGLFGGLTLVGVLVHVVTFSVNEKQQKLSEELQKQLLALEQEKNSARSNVPATAVAAEGKGVEKSGANDLRMAAWEDEEEWELPSVVVEQNVRLKKADWRLVKGGQCKDTDTVLEGMTFLMHDICQLGHTPKDATHLFVYLAGGGLLDNVVYGSECMTEDEGSTAPYARTWHSATKHWVKAALDMWGGKYKEYYFSNGVKDVCVRNLVRRAERWRWFPGYRTAWSFRHAMQKHFKLTVPVKEFAKGPLTVSILRRLEDRNFEEETVAKFLGAKFGGVASFEVMIFDNKSLKGRVLSDQAAPTYVEQLQKLAATDVFIAAHGAALTNIIVMRRGTAVIELFPNNFRYYMFEELARLLGLSYFSHEAVEPPAKCKDCTGRKGLPSLDTPHAFHGSKACKKCNIQVSEQDWYYLFKDAASTVWLSLSRRSDIHKFDVRKSK